MKCCLYTRFFNEDPYIDYVIEHYIKLGFCKIIILKTDNVQYQVNSKYASFVDIHYVTNKGDISLKVNENLLRTSQCDWALIADSDELLVLNKKYSCIQDFIKEKEEKHPQVNGFYFRWAMLDKFDNNTISFSNLVSNYKVHMNEHIKTMVRIEKFVQLKNSHVSFTKPHNIYLDGNIIHYKKPLYPKNKYMYSEAYLIHLHTRSISNIIMKSLYTRFFSKGISNKKNLISLINTFDKDIDPEKLFNQFKECIGAKVILPLKHINAPLLDTNDLLLFQDTINVINEEMETKLLYKELHKLNIDISKYELFVKTITYYLNNNKFFKK